MLVETGASSSSASICAGSNASASRSRLGFTPSIQIVSELTWKNGSLPIAPSALTTPPPVSSSLSRSSEITICGRGPALEMAFDLVGEIMHVDDRALDARRREPVEHMIDQRLAGDRNERLRHVVGQRPHPLAEAGGKHHGGAGSGWH